MKSEEEKEKRIYEGYERIAFGSIRDPIKLLFCEDISPRNLGKMDLFSISEIKRPKGGGIEMKFFDRIKALQCMESFAAENKTDGGFYEALERSITPSGDSDEGELTDEN